LELNRALTQPWYKRDPRALCGQAGKARMRAHRARRLKKLGDRLIDADVAGAAVRRQVALVGAPHLMRCMAGAVREQRALHNSSPPSRLRHLKRLS
jgi:hypothetical protein